jgi:hypothetical protein
MASVSSACQASRHVRAQRTAASTVFITSDATTASGRHASRRSVGRQPRENTPPRFYLPGSVPSWSWISLEADLNSTRSSFAAVAQWELQAAEDGLERDGRHWDAGWAWMLARRR